MATTITVIAKMKYFKISVKSAPVFHYLDIPFSIENLISKTTTIAMPEYNPNRPMS
jgi:hypothetical protein